MLQDVLSKSGEARQETAVYRTFAIELWSQLQSCLPGHVIAAIQLFLINRSKNLKRRCVFGLRSWPPLGCDMDTGVFISCYVKRVGR